jgi:uncharacterized protein (TIGR02271 family)
MESSTFGHVTDWNDVIKKEARGRNDADLGEVLEIRDDIIVTERGTLNKEKFYLPKSIPHGFNGHTLLFDITEEVAKDRFSDESILTQEAKIQLTQPQAAPGAESDRPIPVMEEKLELSKKETIQEASLIMEPIRETKTVEVELKHEELIIEKRVVEKGSSSSNSEDVVRSKTEITIPLKKEDIIVEKKPYVKEEIVINKKQVCETKTISEELISEKVSVRNHEGEEAVEEKSGEE